MVGAATLATISAADRAALARVATPRPRDCGSDRICAAAITRPAVRAVPTIVGRTAQIVRRAASGQPAHPARPLALWPARPAVC